MARDGVKARPDQMTHERLPGESAKAWQAFRCYRDLGADRSHENVRISLGKSKGYIPQIETWSRKFAWVERSKLYDDWCDAVDRQEREAARPKWEELRQRSLTSNVQLTEKLRERIEAMLSHPLTKERVEVSNGRNVTYLIPAGWNFSSIAAMIKTMAELEAATIAEGLLDEENEAFNPETATLEECRSFIERQRKRAKVRPAGD